MCGGGSRGGWQRGFPLLCNPTVKAVSTPAPTGEGDLGREEPFPSTLQLRFDIRITTWLFLLDLLWCLELKPVIQGGLHAQQWEFSKYLLNERNRIFSGRLHALLGVGWGWNLPAEGFQRLIK